MIWDIFDSNWKLNLSNNHKHPINYQGYFRLGQEAQCRSRFFQWRTHLMKPNTFLWHSLNSNLTVCSKLSIKLSTQKPWKMFNWFWSWRLHLHFDQTSERHRQVYHKVFKWMQNKTVLNRVRIFKNFLQKIPLSRYRSSHHLLDK